MTFSHYATKFWNKLPVEIRTAGTVHVLKRKTVSLKIIIENVWNGMSRIYSGNKLLKYGSAQCTFQQAVYTREAGKLSQLETFWMNMQRDIQYFRDL